MTYNERVALSLIYRQGRVKSNTALSYRSDGRSYPNHLVLASVDVNDLRSNRLRRAV